MQPQTRRLFNLEYKGIKIMQTRLQSLFESVTSVAIGYVIAVISQIVIFPFFNIGVSVSDNLMIAGLFTGISIARSYVLRRWFNKAHKRFDLKAHLHRQRFFSNNTFGPGRRTDGVCDHIRKEIKEIEADPNDLEEWIDVVMLAFDGAWRSGHSPGQIVDMIEFKQTKNEARTWPDWRTADPGKAIEHVRAEP